MEDHLLGRLRGDAAEVVGRVVPLAGDIALFVELLRDDADVAGLGVDLDERFLRRVGQALVRGHQRVRQCLEHDLDGDALLALDVLERLHHVGVHRATSFCCFFFALLGVFGAAPHSKTVRALMIWS